MAAFSTVVGVGPGSASSPSNDGIGLSIGDDNSVHVDIDFSGSGDDEHMPARDVSKLGVTIASLTYNGSGATSFVNGCAESTTGTHGAAAFGLMAGARADPALEYHRFMNGTIHELRVYSPPLSDEQRAAVEAELATTWGASLLPASCEMPKQNHSCGALLHAHGLLPPLQAKLVAFINATAADARASSAGGGDTDLSQTLA